MCERCNYFLQLCNAINTGKRHICDMNFSPLERNIMNTTEIKKNWNKQKAELKLKFEVLTDNDLKFADGKKEEMFGKLQIRLGKTREELRKIMAAL